ncbi:hypothetical protein SALBM135S_04917 [Streptomyces alboniger]
MGVPDDRREAFRRMVDGVFDTTLTAERSEANTKALYAALHQLIAAKRTDPGDDMTSLHLPDQQRPPVPAGPAPARHHRVKAAVPRLAHPRRGGRRPYTCGAPVTPAECAHRRFTAGTYV